jgi:rhamnulose-1-phosphate aldolase
MRLDLIYQEISHIAGMLRENGWAERNAGNFSIDITEVVRIHSQGDYLPGILCPELANRVLILSASGSRMWEVRDHPAENTLLLAFDANGRCLIPDDLKKGRVNQPTSELETHLHVHRMFSEKWKPFNAVLHTHTTELIALTQHPEFCDRARLEAALFDLHPETRLFLPDGPGIVPVSKQSSGELPEETALTLQHHDITIWEKHGVVACGTSLTDAFDKCEILAKAATIFLMTRSAGLMK